MEGVIHALGGILLRAIPTFLLVILVHLYLKYMFFRPMQRVLQQRWEATEGARKRAEESLRLASEKTAKYEGALRAARAEIYQAQEQLHRRLDEERTAQVAEARSRAEQAIQNARAQVAEELARAKDQLGKESDLLAEEIADALLKRRVA